MGVVEIERGSMLSSPSKVAREELNETSREPLILVRFRSPFNEWRVELRMIQREPSIDSRLDR